MDGYAEAALVQGAAAALGRNSLKALYKGGDERQFAGLLTDRGVWNSWNDDGDAVRLAGALKISIEYGLGYVRAHFAGGEVTVGVSTTIDVNAAMRHAVTALAAKIWESLHEAAMEALPAVEVAQSPLFRV